MIAPVVHAPLLSQKGQANFDIDFGNVISGSFAIAITDHDALLFSGGAGYRDDSDRHETYIDVDQTTHQSSTTSTTTDISGNYSYKINNECDTYYFDAAYGRYKVIKNKLRNEWFLGMGYGLTENKNSKDFYEGFTGTLSYFSYETSYSDNRRYLSFFIQDDIGWVTNNVELVAVARMQSYYFISRTTSLDQQPTTPDYSKMAFAFEPGVRFAFGGGRFRFYAQLYAVLPIETSGVEWYDEPQFQGGMLYRFRDAIKK